MPPTDVGIAVQGLIVTEQEVDVMCIIREVYPAANVSARWIYSSGDSESAGEPAVEEREDGKHKVTYTSEMTFTRDDHGDGLTCCAEWDGQLTSECASQSILVYCEYNAYSCSCLLSSVALTSVFPITADFVKRAWTVLNKLWSGSC